MVLGTIAAGPEFSPSCPGLEEDTLSLSGGVYIWEIPCQPLCFLPLRCGAEPGCPTVVDFQVNLMLVSGAS